MRVTFLAPRLSPAVCGLADHTALLAEAMARQGVEVGFVHVHPQQPASTVPYGPVARWAGGVNGLREVIASQRPNWIWVQLSGYGYSRWGAPFLLGRALRALRRNNSRIRLAIYLHETHCKPYQLGLKGPLLSPWQRYTVGGVTRVGDVVFTSNEIWRQWGIDQYGVGSDRIFSLPIGSNIPDAHLGSSQRLEARGRLGWAPDEVVAVTFGSFGSQIRTLQLFKESLRKAIGAGFLHRLICVGGSGSDTPAELKVLGDSIASPNRFVVLGKRPASEIAVVLACSDFALCHTPASVLEKSGAFVACALAGLAVLTITAPGAQSSQSQTALPVLNAEAWDWQQVHSPNVAAIRARLQDLARSKYLWSAIATEALGRMQASGYDHGSGGVNQQPASFSFISYPPTAARSN